MSIPVQAGESRVEMNFTRTWDRTAGVLISLLSISGVILFWRCLKRKSPAEVAAEARPDRHFKPRQAAGFRRSRLLPRIQIEGLPGFCFACPRLLKTA